MHPSILILSHYLPLLQNSVSVDLPSWKSSICRAWDGKAWLNHNLVLTLPVGPGTGAEPEPVCAVCVPRLLQACGRVHSHTRVSVHMYVPGCPEWASRELSVCGWRVPCSAEERPWAELGPGCAPRRGWVFINAFVSGLGSSCCESGHLLPFPPCPQGGGTHVKYLRFCRVSF